jgi:hypothetical protein
MHELVILLIGNFHTFFSFAKNDFVSLFELISLWDLEDLGDHFHIPLSEVAFSEYLQLQTIFLNTPGYLDEDQPLAFHSCSAFLVSKAYKASIDGHLVCPTLKWLSKTCCQYKHKVFFSGYFCRIG